MTKNEAITLHAKKENWKKFPVFVWTENEMFITEIDGVIYTAKNVFGLDSRLDEVGVSSPRNLYCIDGPDYESID
jgi:hypothetical protein